MTSFDDVVRFAENILEAKSSHTLSLSNLGSSLGSKHPGHAKQWHDLYDRLLRGEVVGRLQITIVKSNNIANTSFVRLLPYSTAASSNASTASTSATSTQQQIGDDVLLRFVETLLEKAPDNRLGKNSIGGQIGSAMHGRLDEWRQMCERLARQESVGRLVLDEVARDGRNPSFVRLITVLSPSSTFAVRPALIAAIVTEIQRVVGDGLILVNEIASTIRGQQLCTAEEWQILIDKLQLVFVGNIAMDMPTANRNSWRLRLKTSAPFVENNVAAPAVSVAHISTAASEFRTAITYSLDFVRAHPFCHCDVLGAHFGAEFGSVLWKRLRNDLICDIGHTPLLDDVIWRDKDGHLALSVAQLETEKIQQKENPQPKEQQQQLSAPHLPFEPPFGRIGGGGGGGDDDDGDDDDDNSRDNIPPRPPRRARQSGPSFSSDIVVVTSVETCADARQFLAGCAVVGVDCEGGIDVSEPGFYLRLVQVGGASKGSRFRTFLFDLHFCAEDSKAEIFDCLRSLMSSSTVKVFHDLRLDVAAICKRTELDRAQVQSLFDTQVAFEVLADNNIVQRAYGGPRASLNDVLKAFDLPVNKQKQAFHEYFDRVGKSFWRQPVLTDEQIQYAADDVRYLPALYEKLLQSLRNGLFDWSEQYSHWYDEKVAGEEGDDIPFGLLCMLTFDDVVLTTKVPRIVPSIIAEGDIVSRASAQRIGMPPPSSAVVDAFVPEFVEFVDALPLAVREALAEIVTSESQFDRQSNDDDDNDDQNNSGDAERKLQLSLVEVVIDVGFPVMLFFRDGSRKKFFHCIIDEKAMFETMLDWQAKDIVVGHDNRVTLPQTLHRISVKRDRMSAADGLTCRVGMHCPGAAALLRDVVARVAVEQKSLLLLG